MRAPRTTLSGMFRFVLALALCSLAACDRSIDTRDDRVVGTWRHVVVTRDDPSTFDLTDLVEAASTNRDLPPDLLKRARDAAEAGPLGTVESFSSDGTWTTRTAGVVRSGRWSSRSLPNENVGVVVVDLARPDDEILRRFVAPDANLLVETDGFHPNAVLVRSSEANVRGTTPAKTIDGVLERLTAAPAPATSAPKPMTKARLVRDRNGILKGMESYRRIAPETPYTTTHIEACDRILSNYMAHVFALDAKSGDEAFLTLLRSTVFELNTLNAAAGGKLIETDQREAIVAYLMDAGALAGFRSTSDDPTLDWREW